MFSDLRKRDAARLIAFYLPQYHPIPENDAWWGKGFTEWTNAAKAKPLFHGHYQPHVPSDLGFYDLRLSESRIAQADMARAYGIEGFCYWHYWFGGGQRLLERPFNEVLHTGEPDFPFCLAWANQTWSGIWHGRPDRTLIEQRYLGCADDEKHFYALLPAFCDRRYLKINGEPIFYIYRPEELPNADAFMDLWKNLAIKAGLKGIYFIGNSNANDRKLSAKYDAIALDCGLRDLMRHHENGFLNGVSQRWRKFFGKPITFEYGDYVKRMKMLALTDRPLQLPTLLPNWDNTPRCGTNGIVLNRSTPDMFRDLLNDCIAKVSHRTYEKRVVFLKSWNEWAEGNHLEPDFRFGKAYLEVIRESSSAQT
jgi:hypothetical protein